MCKPGGTIALANFTPEGLAADFFEVFGPYLPPPRSRDQSPMLWGSQNHMRDLLGARLSSLVLTPRSYIERAASPGAYCELIKRTLGPVVAIYGSLADRPAETATLDRAFLQFAERCNSGTAEGPAEYRYEYLLVVGQK